ncbi:SusD/RagB family nutrient-binding outer membrane lipoprotein [Arcicella rigui]|uniref:SusD/RagB family nutrient-binding outer membrane lipoprotein n=1 Tax=Arcicella rigui TaxID=797020 RepID=A0ABU5Q790_9BACT|nr:SusD/RagB family nutrient-binding outer membrane lipoprotein [Arcicella rigui]MEA5138711.1 SusD/RagB family nutrient-binding outer membrane lipoprotein [Arcicella rigui]
MKKITLYISLIVACSFLGSCDKGFDELNTNKVNPTSLNPVYELNNATLRTSFTWQSVIYEAAIVQQIVSPYLGVNAGGNVNQNNTSVTGVNWQRYYREVNKHLVDVIAKTKGDANRSNLYNMARIWKAYTFMILTDSYGDVPYSEAGLGYLQGTVFPKYDAQQAIYTDILKELDEASAALDANKTKEVSDVIYAGDITKWKRLGYSLLLRAAMRLTKVDANTAQNYVKKAFAGGVMQSNADNCLLRHSPAYTNEVGVQLNGSERANFYLHATLVDYLKNANDPRLGIIALKYNTKAQSATDNTKDPAKQIGIPAGYDQSSIAKTPNYPGEIELYSQVDRIKVAKSDAPCFFVTFGQTQLLLAEAAQRGWISGNVSDYYKAGVKGHIQQFIEHDASLSVSDATIDAYFTANPFNASKALEQINTQYWLASFMNSPEAFANFRRSGFPALTPNPYPGKEIQGNFINRLSYPVDEISVNKANLDAAVARQGADNLDTKVWWHK